MIRSLYFTKDSQLQQDLSVVDFPALLREPGTLLWVDFEATPPDHDEPILRDIFHFHPLAIDDALQESHVPKLDDWGSYLYIVLHSVVLGDPENGLVDTRELDVFLGENFMVTHHDLPIQAIERVRTILTRDDRHLRQGADHLLYRLVDEVVASYMPVVEGLDDQIDLAEDIVFSNPQPETLEQIFQLKRAVLYLRRMIGPQREVLNKLARDDYAVIDPRERVYFRDVYDHLVRLHDITESIRDLVSGTLDSYLSMVNNRMNDIMKTLTVITTLFMPLSFVASFFGMNFFGPVETFAAWTGEPALMLTLVGMALTPVLMFLWMRRRGWM